MSRAALVGLLRVSLVAGLPALATAAELADPTRPALLPPAPAPGAAATADVRLLLDSIFISETRRVAVIDGRRVRVGDPVGGARVVAIELSGVRLRSGSGSEWLLTLTGVAGDGVKQPASRRSQERRGER